MRNKPTLLFTITVTLLVYLSFTHTAFADTVVDRKIDFDQHWTLQNSPYLIEGKVTIRRGARVTVDPGVVIRLKGLTVPRIDVDGEFIVEGSAEAPVILDGDPGMNIYTDRGVAAFSHIVSEGYFHGHALKEGNIHITNSDLSGFSLYNAYSSHTTLDSVKVKTAQSIGVYLGSSLDIKNVTIEGLSEFSPIRVTDNSVFKADGLNLSASPYGSAIHIDSSHVQIKRSNIIGGEIGVKSANSSVDITDSTMSGQTQFAVSNDDPDKPVNAVRNYWGHSSGPYHAMNNSSGQGGVVSDFVEFAPWLEGAPVACCSSVLFLPGIKASRLYVVDGSEERKAWEPFGDHDLEMLMLDESGSSSQSVRVKEGDVIEEAYVNLAGPNIYKSFISDLRDLADADVISDWKAYAYDWRYFSDKIARENALTLAVEDMAANSRTGKVSIITHSNGGLIAKSLAKHLDEVGKSTLLDKMILVAAPQVGAPQAVGSLLHGFDEGIPFLASAAASRFLGNNMPSAYGLLPSFSDPVTISFAPSSSIPWIVRMRNMFGTLIKGYSNLIAFLKDNGEGRDHAASSNLAIPARLNPFLIDQGVRIHEDIDQWVPPEGMRVIQIGAKGMETVRGIEYYEGTRNHKATLLYKPVFTLEGDGVVPIESAWHMPAAQNVEKWWINLESLNDDSLVNRSHADIFEIPSLRSFIKGTLSSVPDADASSTLVVVESEAYSNQKERVRVFLHGLSADLQVSDSEGRHARPAGPEKLIQNDIPGVRYARFGEVALVSIPKEKRRSISIEVNGIGYEEVPVSPVILEIDEAVGDMVATSTTFQDIQVSASTTIVVDLSGLDTLGPALQIDMDGDGNIDDTVLKESDAFEDSVDVEEPESPQETALIEIRAVGRSGSRRQVVALDPIILIDVPTDSANKGSYQEGISTTPITGSTRVISASAEIPDYPDDQIASAHQALQVIEKRVRFGFIDHIVNVIKRLFSELF